jgi:NADP-dependent 3-hydroxy acid dehydrogenase YdfG
VKKVILITGVSSGFGKESAGLLAEAGHKVYGTVRKEPAQAEKYNILKMDLTDPLSIKTSV